MAETTRTKEALQCSFSQGSQPSDLALISQYGIRSLADDALGKKEEYQTPPPASQGVRGALKRAQSKDFGLPPSVLRKPTQMRTVGI
eukprot:3450832-Amphidinium_carterae.1